MLNQYIVESSDKILSALKKINSKDNAKTKTLLVSEDDRIIGTITDGDIRRGILNGSDISGPVKTFINKDFKFFENQVDLDKLIDFRLSNLKLIPILDKQRKIIDLIDLSKIITKLPLTAVIMAGGLGSRLGSLTKNIPKPMLKVAGKPMLEYNIDKLIKYGIKEVIISVNYLKDQIIKYFGDGSEKGISISYLEEKKPLGTAGSLSLLKEFSNDTILLINSDILSDINFENFYLHHNLNKVSMTVLTTEYSYNIPYAVLETEKEKVIGFNEKPSLKFNINGGIYLIDKNALSLIPKDSFFDSTDLMTKMLERKDLNHFTHTGFWTDIGKKEDFERADIYVKNNK